MLHQCSTELVTLTSKFQSMVEGITTSPIDISAVNLIFFGWCSIMNLYDSCGIFAYLRNTREIGV